MNDVSTEAGQGGGDAVLAVVGVLGTVVTVAAVVWKEATLAVGIAAGAGWMLAAALHVMGRAQRTRLTNLEGDVRALKSDLLEARRAAGEWSASASDVSRSMRTLVEYLPQAQQPPPRRSTPRPKREPEQTDKTEDAR